MKVEVTDNSKQVKAEFERAVLRALEECGLFAESVAKKLCPVDTGNLRNSISHTVARDEQVAYVGTNVEYAPYVELGTSRQRAQPYLKPAVNDNANTYRQIIDKELKNA